MAGAQVVTAASCIEKQRLGYQAISLTNFTSDTLEPAIAAASKVEIGGALFEFASDEALTGWAGIANSSDVYIHLTVTGASVAASFSTTAPTWDDAKQGWYSGAVRVIGGLYKDSSGNYSLKWLYEEKQIASVKRYGSGAVAMSGAVQMGSIDTAMLRTVIEIGDWNMDSTASVNVAHGLTASKIRRVAGLIRDDAGTILIPIPFSSTIGGFDAVCDAYVSGANVVLVRSGAYLDNVNWNATSYNRGWITIEYEP